MPSYKCFIFSVFSPRIFLDKFKLKYYKLVVGSYFRPSDNDFILSTEPPKWLSDKSK